MGSVAMWRESAMRRFVATRNADRCEHISPAIYTNIAATENSAAAQDKMRSRVPVFAIRQPPFAFMLVLHNI